MIIEIPDETPQAWRDLLEGLAILSKGAIPRIGPLQCEHDYLTVSAEPSGLAPGDGARLDELGFHYSRGEDHFYSNRFGSA